MFDQSAHVEQCVLPLANVWEICCHLPDEGNQTLTCSAADADACVAGASFMFPSFER